MTNSQAVFIWFIELFYIAKSNTFCPLLPQPWAFLGWRHRVFSPHAEKKILESNPNWHVQSLTFRAFDRPPSSTVDRIKIVFFDTLTLIESGRLIKTSGTPSFIVQRVELMWVMVNWLLGKIDQTCFQPLRKTGHDPSHHYPRYWQLSRALPLAWLLPTTRLLVSHYSQLRPSLIRSHGVTLVRSFSGLTLAVGRRPLWRPRLRQRLKGYGLKRLFEATLTYSGCLR